MEYDAVRRAAAEFVGTFTLVFAGVGSIAVLQGGPSSASPSRTASRSG